MRYQTFRNAVVGMLSLSLLAATLLVNTPSQDQTQTSAFVYLPDVTDRGKTTAKPSDSKRQGPSPCKAQPDRKTGVRDPFKQLLRGIML